MCVCMCVCVCCGDSGTLLREATGAGFMKWPVASLFLLV